MRRVALRRCRLAPRAALPWALAVAWIAGWACAPSPHLPDVPVVPDAVVDVTFADLGAFADLIARGGRAGLLPTAAQGVSQSGLEQAGLVPPVNVAVRRGSGDIVVAAAVTDAARLHGSLAVSLPGAGLRLQRVLARVDAVVDDRGVTRALLRVGDREALLVPAPSDVLASAALLEALGTHVIGERRGRPPHTTLHANAPFEDIADIDGAIGVEGDDIVARVALRVNGELRELTRGLTARSPRFACAVEEGAVAALRLPPLLGENAVSALGAAEDDEALGADSFDGRVVIALHPPPPGTPVLDDDRATWASLVVAARPRGDAVAGLRSAVREAGPGSPRAVAGRTITDVVVEGRPWRTITSLVDEQAFVIGVGVAAPVDRVAAGVGCDDDAERLLFVDGDAARALIARAAPELAIVDDAARLLGLERALPSPWTALRALRRVTIDGRPGATEDVVDLVIRLRLGGGRAAPHPRRRAPSRGRHRKGTPCGGAGHPTRRGATWTGPC